MNQADAHLAADAMIGALAARLVWQAIDHGIVRPFAAAAARATYRRIDQASGDRFPNLPS
jgi:hypothetical protein